LHDRCARKGIWRKKINHFARPILRTQTRVTAVTEGRQDLRDTSIVNMVRRAGKKVLFEPGDTRQLWKGEAAASLGNYRDHQ
jgi:hypothetical protein